MFQRLFQPGTACRDTTSSPPFAQGENVKTTINVPCAEGDSLLRKDLYYINNIAGLFGNFNNCNLMVTLHQKKPHVCSPALPYHSRLYLIKGTFAT